MRLWALLLLTIVGVSLAGLSLWAMTAEPDRFLSVTSPIVLHYQLGLVVDGPSPDLTVVLYSHSMMTGVTVQHMRLPAPLMGLFFVLLWIVMIMVADALPRRRKPARTS